MSYGFKLHFIFYDVPGKTNKKILFKVYRDQILEPVVKPWLLEGQDFVLKEDVNNGYAKAHNRNIV